MASVKPATERKGVPDVGVADHQRQCALGAGAADEDGYLAHGRWDQLVEACRDAFQPGLEQVESCLPRAEFVSVSGVVLLVPARTEAEYQASVADVIDGAGHVGEQIGIAVTHPGHQQPDLGAVSDLPPRTPMQSSPRSW